MPNRTRKGGGRFGNLYPSFFTKKNVPKETTFVPPANTQDRLYPSFFRRKGVPQANTQETTFVPQEPTFVPQANTQEPTFVPQANTTSINSTQEHETKYAVIVSHNSRIQCLLAKINPIGQNPKPKKIRFQNCCVLKINIYARTTNTEPSIKVDLLYSGEITDSDKFKPGKTYYCTKDDPRLKSYQGGTLPEIPLDDPDNIYADQAQNPMRVVPMDKFTEFTPIIGDALSLKRLGIQLPFNMNYEYYLVRHGQSEHNQKKSITNNFNNFNLKLDTPLLPEAKLSAERAGDAISNNLKDLNLLKMCFTSDLLRTRETLNAIKSKWVEHSIFNEKDNSDDYFKHDDIGIKEPKLATYINNIPVVVLPCASEVAGSGVDGDCDSSISITGKMARENYPACTTQTINRIPNCMGDWSTYLEFYGQKIRGEDDTLTGVMTRRTSSRFRCRDTTLLAMAIYCMDFKGKISLSDFIGKKPSGGKNLKSKKRMKRR